MNIARIGKFTITFLLLLVNLQYSFTCKAQEFTPNLHNDDIKISLLTCTSGSELYSAYGHSAVRLVDRRLGLDVVFNYGTFDFDTPFFYLKFLNGTLDYMLSTADFSRFIRSYSREGRGVSESELILSTRQKQEIERLLIENAQPENRFYRYDFFFDNCATRIRDIAFKVADVNEAKMKAVADDVSFRDLIHEKVGPNDWSGFGIDIILGVRADKKASAYDKAFLPDYLNDLFHAASITSADVVLLEKKVADVTPGVVTPVVCASLFLLIIVGIELFEERKRKWFFAFDIVLAVVCSLLSLLLWYLWVVSEIKITSYNLNVLWASVLWMPMIYALAKRKGKMIKALAVANLALLAVYFVALAAGVQYASVPIMIIAFALGWRCLTLRKRV